MGWVPPVRSIRCLPRNMDGSFNWFGSVWVGGSDGCGGCGPNGCGGAVMYHYQYLLLRFLSFSIRNGCKIEIMTEAIYVLSSTSSDKTSSDDDLEDEDYRMQK